MKTLIGLIFFFSLSVCTCINAQPGTLDNTFGNAGRVTTSTINNNGFIKSAIALPDGSIICAGRTMSRSTLEDFIVVKYTANGNLDPAFGTGGKVIFNYKNKGRDLIGGMAIQKDGKIILAGTLIGSFTQNKYTIEIVRLNADGTIDSSFSTDGKDYIGITNGYRNGTSVAIQDDGKIVIGGYSSSTITYIQDFTLLRYNTNGSLDPAFGQNGIVTTHLTSNNSRIADIDVQKDGKIVAAGIDSIHFALTRYNSDGTLDNSFGSGGKVITYSNNLDISSSMAGRSDGKIVVAGTTAANIYAKRDWLIRRYNADGSPDLTFGNAGEVVTALGVDYYVPGTNDVKIQKNGKILVAGTAFNNASSSNEFTLMRYNINGSNDTTFGDLGKVSISFSGYYSGASFGIALQKDGKILQAGNQVKNPYSNSPIDLAIVRLNGDPVAIVASAYSENSIRKIENKIKIFPNPVHDIIQVSGLDASKITTLTIIDINGKVLQKSLTNNNSYSLDINSLLPGIYYLHTSNGGKEISLKFIKE